MKSLIRFTLASVVILLLGISMVSAHGSDDPTSNNNHMADSHMNGSMMDGNYIRDLSDHMLIEGRIEVNQAITLILEVSPSEEMQQHMNDHMESGGHMGGQSHMMDDYKNIITVEFYSLLEFEDISGNGYSSDDIVVSNYSLDDQNLNQPQIIDDRYVIISKDNTTFLVDVDLEFEDELFHGFKWSVAINYQFQSNSSKLVMLHKINTMKGSIMDQHHMRHGNMNQRSHTQYHENHLNDNHDHLPMSFDWATTVEIDGREKSVIATSEEDIFALSVPQGNSILYDPQISVDVADIKDIDKELSNFLSSVMEFVDTISSPTLIGLILGFSSLVAMAVYAFYKRNYQGEI